MIKNTLDENNYTMIVENMVDGLFVVNKDHFITFINKSAEDILGYKKDEIIGKRCDFLNSPTCMYVNSDLNGGCPLFSKGNIIRKRCVVTAKDGSEKYLIKNARTLRDEKGDIIGGVENIVDITELVEKEREINLLRRELNERTSFKDITGSHYAMQNIYGVLDLAKDSNSPVLIHGESGTGKELAAKTIHYTSHRSSKPFVKVDCSSLSEALLDRDIFGHVKGAFPDEVCDRMGRFEEADGGTIFLDEIGNIPPAVQAGIISALHEKVVKRLGENSSRKVDVRIIASTNKDVQELVKDGQIREDFYYQINVIPVNIPPLRQRKTDIPLLVEHFIKKLSSKTGKHIFACDQPTIELLIKYNWPGNVRELENAIEYAFVTCRTDTIRSHNIPEHIKKTHFWVTARKKKKETEEVARIVNALKVSNGNRTRAAVLLGYSRVTLWKKMKKLMPVMLLLIALFTQRGSVANAADLQEIIISGSGSVEKGEFLPGDTIQYQAVFSFDMFWDVAIFEGTVTGNNWVDVLDPMIRFGGQGSYTETWIKTVPLDAEGEAKVNISMKTPLQNEFEIDAVFSVLPNDTEYKGSSVCGSCHKEIYDGWQLSGHSPNIGCELCHGPGGDHIVDYSKDSIAVYTSSELYGRCHTRNDGVVETKGGFINPLQQFSEMNNSSHKGVLECLTCHDPHYSPSLAGNQAIKISCRECHSDKSIALGMQSLQCEDCHMPLAIYKSEYEGAGFYREGDGCSHIWRIKGDAAPGDMFNLTGTGLMMDSKGFFLTLNFTCLGCHDGKDETLLDMQAVMQTYPLVH
jgi:two-component system, NtrC family, response regulator HydG